MIRLTCANCQAQLEVDDAFAGGVCRCKHCGAIQTVPRAGRQGAPGKALAGQSGGGDEPKTLYQVKSRAGLASTPSGLEELAEAVHGSGLTGSGLLNRPVPRGPLPPRPPKPRRTGLIVGLVVTALVVAGGVAAYVATRPAAPATPLSSGATAAKMAAFAKIPFSGNKVVYVLDRGDATLTFFPALRDLTVESVRSLGPNRLFQVVLWENNAVDAYPALTAGYASDSEADKLARWFDTVATGRFTDAVPALKLALAGSPDTVMLVTGKSLQLDASFADTVLKMRPPRTVIHTVTLGETAPEDPLRTIAAKAGGTFKALDGAELGPSGP